MDWVKWHEHYEASPWIIERIRIVRLHISECLSRIPPGPTVVISVCAGDGRDIIGVLHDHARRNDVRARLVELNADLLETGRQAATAAGLVDRMEFVTGDATQSDAYAGVAPADLVLVCGVFGNVRTKEIGKLIDSLRFLCKSGGYVVWTRYISGDGLSKVETIRKLFRQTEFEEVRVDMSAAANHAIGTHRYLGECLSLPEGKQMFEFTGFDNTGAAWSLWNKIRRLFR